MMLMFSLLCSNQFVLTTRLNKGHNFKLLMESCSNVKRRNHTQAICYIVMLKVFVRWGMISKAVHQ